MKQRIITGIIILLAVSVYSHGSIGGAVLAFLVAGTIPGTAATVPFWLMMTLYCLAITILVTNFVEDLFSFRRRMISNRRSTSS
jgi:hypothetical protein